MSGSQMITLLLPEPLPRRALFFPLKEQQTSCTDVELIEFVATYFGFETERIGISRHYSSTTSFEAGQHVELDWITTGLLGGKGGFGAGLRAMGKTAAAKQSQPSMDFSLSRDLQGRRLGAANTALLIAKAKEEGKVDANTWLLEKPSWLDAKKVEKHEKQSAKRKKDLQDLKAADRSKAVAPVESIKKAKEAEFDVRLARELEEREHAVASLVTLGLQRLKRQKLQNVEPTDGDADDGSLDIEKAPDGWKVNSGVALITSSSPTSFVITGISEFATVSWDFVVSCFEVTLLTDGLVQVGFAQSTSLHSGMENESDGVGDVKGSVAFDFARRLVWRDGESAIGMPPVEEQSQDFMEDDLVTVRCELKQNRATFSLLQSEVNVDIESTPSSSGEFVPSISLEKNESVEITFITPAEDESVHLISNSSSSSASKDANHVAEEIVTLESLKALGADQLKEELRNLGLKFGGSVEERAKRLLIAKTIPKAEWPRSIFPN